MTVHLTKEFLNDLKCSRDVRFVSKVLDRTIGDDGAFTQDRDDHRYDGIEDGWIRYITGGSTAYRVIFIRKGEDVFLYRAGVHSVEDNLRPPRNFGGALSIRRAPENRPKGAKNLAQDACLLKTKEADFVNRHIESMYHVKHREIWLISPFIDLDLLESRHGFGRFLDRAAEEGTFIGLITSSAQDEERVEAFKSLQEREINVFFFDGLHAKVYLFDVDLASRNSWQQGVQSHAIVGSSNLTNAGLGLNDAAPNEELNCRIPMDLFGEAQTYVYRLMKLADDYNSYAFRQGSRKPR